MTAPSRNTRLTIALCWVLPALTVGLCLFNGITLPVRITEGVAGALVLTGLMMLGFFVPARFQPAYVGSLVLGAFGFGLAEIWCQGASAGLAIGGLLPNTDARNYWSDANRVAEGGALSPWGGRRPLAGSFLSSLCWLSNGNLRWTLALLAGCGALGVTAFCWELRRQFGWIAAALGLLVVLLFQRRFLGTTMSESAGLAFACLAAALWLRGFATARPALLAGGIFLLSLALCIRAGPFFLLATLPLGALVLWRDKPRKAALILGLLVAAGISGMAANFGILKILGSQGTAPFGNHAVVAYGVLYGGDWTKAQRDHPELGAMSEREQAAFLYRMIWRDVREDPSLPFKGAWRAIASFTPWTGYPPFLFVGHPLLGMLLFWGWIGGALAGFALFKRRPRTVTGSAGALGIVISLPFAPPWDADGMRAYAAGVPFLIVTVVCASELVLLAWEKWRGPRPETDATRAPDSASPGLWATAAIATALVLILPPLVNTAFPMNPRVKISHYNREDNEITLDLSSGSLLRFTSAPRSRPAALRVDDFVSRQAGYDVFWPTESKFLAERAAPGILFAAGGSTQVAVILLKDRPGLIDHKQTIRGRLEYMPDGYFFLEENL